MSQPTLKEQAAADADTTAYGQIWVKNTVPNVPWFTDDAGNDGQFMLMRSNSINADSDAADVQGCNVLWVDTSGGNVVLGGLANGVDNQLVYVFKYDQSNILTIEHQEATGTQKFMLDGGDLVYDGTGLCQPFICKGGTWYLAAYPRSFRAQEYKMKIIVDEEGNKMIVDLCDVALKVGGLRNLRSINRVLNSMNLEKKEENENPKQSKEKKK